MVLLLVIESVCVSLNSECCTSEREYIVQGGVLNNMEQTSRQA